jgi:hypothetical protein
MFRDSQMMIPFARLLLLGIVTAGPATGTAVSQVEVLSVVTVGDGAIPSRNEQHLSLNVPQSSEPDGRPAISYPYLRYDEDWSIFCNDKIPRTGLDRFKCLRFSGSERSYVTLGGEIKEVYEFSHNQYWGTGPQDENGWVIERYLLDADWHFNSAWRLYAELQAGLENGRNGGPRPYDEDKPDVHEFFLDYRKTSRAKAITLRAGRQELSYGSGRLVDVRYGLNTRISFDGVKAIAKLGPTQIEAFATRPTLQRTGFFNDTPDSKQIFWGIYATVPLNPWSTNDFYYFGIDKKSATFTLGTDRYISHTLGARWAGRRNHTDFDLEANGQLGRFGAGDVRAWSASANQGYTWESLPGRPHAFLHSDITSGDNNLKDHHLGTFFPLFAKGKYFGEADLNGPVNTIDMIPAVDLHLAHHVVLTPSYGVFWRQTMADGVYGFAGNLFTPAQARSSARLIGQQAEIDAAYPIAPRVLVRIAYEHFFTGTSLKQMMQGRDVNYATVWFNYHF